MLETRVNQAVSLIRDFLARRSISIEKVVVFGSYARNAQTVDSDVDIAVVSGDFEGKDIFQRAAMLKGLKWALAEKIPLPFDIISVSSSEWNDESSLMVEHIKSGAQVAA